MATDPKPIVAPESDTRYSRVVEELQRVHCAEIARLDVALADARALRTRELSELAHTRSVLARERGTIDQLADLVRIAVSRLNDGGIHGTFVADEIIARLDAILRGRA